MLVARLKSCRATSRDAGVALLVSLSGFLTHCGRVENVQLGRESPPFGPFGAPHALAELGDPAQNPTLTGDLLEVYFTTNRTGGVGNNDTWFARRASVNEPFGAPELVPVVNSTSEESSPAIAFDGLTLWFGSKRSGGQGGMDIWVSTRTGQSSSWSEPTTVTELNTPGYELPRPPGNHGLQMAVSSYVSGENYHLNFSTRATVDSPWGTPKPVAELADAGMIRVDGFLTDDGTMLLFNNEQTDNVHSEILRTWRLSSDDAFAPPVSVGDGINSPTLNRDPWLSPDGNHFFFSSNRSGSFMVYQADIDADK
jgi:Tol biopolymer transport system component